MMDLDMKLSPHFTLRELIHSDKAIELGIDNTPPAEVIDRLKIVCCRILEPVRDHYGVESVPNSGYRSPKLNRAVGGSKTSRHVTGQAVDFEVPGVSNYDLAKWMAISLTYDQLILEHYTPGDRHSGWVHCSIVSGQNRMQCLTIGDGFKRDGLFA